ncbi:Chemotaxis regulator - transmits chemoreceptor signals to flagellar motor components CheY [hydrothermal vent metagenome]|uniref:Chemotaxis regulator - transmits chemoreceptor signals to flagellar motor components CheY n=1 Tax=hydrothermal vent metagenome TaxID=652676 RepID=A0A3B1A170_9ZZZZ
MALDLTGKKILVIDDFPEMRSMLRKMGVAFRATDIDDAKDGDGALKAMTKKKYDIILCDYNLGDGKDGQQILEEAKFKELINYSTTFMMITAENTTEMVMGAMEYQPDGYLTKPFTKGEFSARLEKIKLRKSDLADIEKAIQRKDPLGAIVLCDKKLADKPSNTFEILKTKADLCEKLGDVEASSETYEKALAIRDVPWAKLGVAKVHYHHGDYMMARDMLQDLIEENSSIVEAYDWLAKTFEALDDLIEAQKTLVDAINVSPKAILRQKELARIAYKNNDLETAESSFKKAIRVGKNSCFKSPSDFTGLAKVHLDKGSPTDALKTMSGIRDNFNNTPDATLQVAVMESAIYNNMGQQELAEKALDEATHVFNNIPGTIPTDITMDLAKSCFALGKADQAEDFIKYVVRNHHDDPEILKQTQELFNSLGMEEAGQALINSTRQEVIDINNKGVKLAKEGKLEESIDFFAKAASGMPENLTVNLNAAQSLLMFMQKKGKQDKHLYQTRQYLDRIRKIKSSDEKYQKLLAVYKKITGTK